MARRCSATEEQAYSARHRRVILVPSLADDFGLRATELMGREGNAIAAGEFGDALDVAMVALAHQDKLPNCVSS